MNFNFRLRSKVFAFAAILIVAASSCKKDSDPTTTTDPDPANSSRSELTKDSIFYYAKEVYLWNDAVPSYEAFNPRQYTGGKDDLANYNKELFAITQLKINPETQKPYEYRATAPGTPKYSNIQDINDKNPVAVITAKGSVDTEGNGNDLGIYTFKAYGSSDSNFILFVGAVSPGSPAAKAGLTRGTQITGISKINGGTGGITNLGSDFAAQRNTINSLLDNTVTSVTLTGVYTSGKTFTKTISKASYKSSPIYKDSVITVRGKKIGYLAYARFSQLTNGDSPNPTDANLDPVFSKFAAAGVTDLIVDLRYNGGGYVNAAEYLINLIAPSSASGTMYSEVYNSLMQSNKATILKNQPLTDGAGKIRYDGTRMLTYADVDYSIEGNTNKFNKKGNLTGIKNVVFIVTGGTASASELTINCLKPVVNVKLVGAQTYGKPVGFFPVTIENRYDVYFSMFETKNAKGEGSYYAGFKPDVFDDETNQSIIFDDATHDFGDISESYMSSAVNLIVPNAVSASSRASMSVDLKSGRVSGSRLKDFSNQLNQPKKFVGMLETRYKVK
jgi:C-terminal processing protease CtpA/Prc